MVVTNDTWCVAFIANNGYGVLVKTVDRSRRDFTGKVLDVPGSHIGLRPLSIPPDEVATGSVVDNRL